MPTPTKGPRLGGGPAHERLMLANLATALFEHGRITTTEAKAKRLRPLAERLITFAKRGDLHARRRVLTVIRDKRVVHDAVHRDRPALRRAATGGYTRITKIGPRKGDNAPMAVIELVEALTVAAGRGRRGRGARPSARPRRPPAKKAPAKKAAAAKAEAAESVEATEAAEAVEAEAEDAEDTVEVEPTPRTPPRPTTDRGRRRPRRRPTPPPRTPRTPRTRPTTPADADRPRDRRHADGRARLPRRGDGGLVRVCGSTWRTTAPTSPAGPRQPGLRTVQGDARGRARRWCCGCPRRPGSRWPGAPTPACTRAARSPTSTSRGGAWRALTARTAPVRALAGLLPPDVRVRAAAIAPRGFRRALLGAVAALRVPGLRRPGGAGPAAAARGALAPARAGSTSHCMHAAATAAARRSTTSPRSAGAARAATTRPDAARPSAGPREPDGVLDRDRGGATRSATRWCARWSGRCSRSGRAGVPWRGRPGCWPPRTGTRPCTWSAARAHPRGGRLPARRRAGRPRRRHPAPPGLTGAGTGPAWGRITACASWSPSEATPCSAGASR